MKKDIKKTNKTYNSLKGKKAAVTGATGSLGNEICIHIAALEADLILMDRNRDKSEKLGKKLKKEFKNLNIEYITVDMEDFESVKEAAQILKEHKPDIFISNAGTYRSPRKKCSSGFDSIFQINFLSPYYIIKTLLPEMRKIGGRVVSMSSISHKATKINRNDVEAVKTKSAEKAYANSKRLITLSLFELFKHEKNVKLSTVHPGICYTNLMSNYPKIISSIIKYPMKLIFMSPKKASLSVISGIFTDCGYYEWIGPNIFGIWGYPKKTTLKKPAEDELETLNVVLNSITDIQF